MKYLLHLFASIVILFSSCSKELSRESTPDPLTGFQGYHILKGQQYADNNVFAPVSYAELKFQVYFDETAVYKTIDPSNQYDINKLYGFSDNNSQHHEYSARIGWRWSEGALRLFGYIYNNTVRSEQEITTIEIGRKIDCSIKVAGDKYFFTVGSKTITMPRAATSPIATGYKLYPYFGGDELAPQDITIWIKE